ncbi:hypothetical protein [Calidifontibacter terrae]
MTNTEADIKGERGDRVALKFSEASKRTGIDVDVLRQLAQDSVLPGVYRSSRGHAYIYADALPTFHELVELLTSRREAAVAAAQSALDRVDQELEAIRGDLALALDDPLLPLGDDVVAAQTIGRGDESTLRSALMRFDFAVFDLRRYDEAWKSAQRVAPRHTN